MPVVKPLDAADIIGGTHADPFAILGLHQISGKWTIVAFIPGAQAIEVIDVKTEKEIVVLRPVDNAEGLFAGIAFRRKKSFAYRLRISKAENSWILDDPYRFGPVIGALDEHLISEGSHHRLWNVLGAHVITHEGVSGTHFALWAPNASRVSVVGDCNGWDGRVHAMRRRGNTGVWEIFIPGLGEDEFYKFELLDQNGGLLPQKSDPFGFGAEHAPKTASVVRQLKAHSWSDKGWMSRRDALQRIDQPISIYEVHLGSWKRVP
ncbi:MAG: GlgB N-terminal domain-containing protein, partial [Paracoccaceae bacterium]